MTEARTVSIMPLLLALTAFSVECGGAGPSIVEKSPFLPPNFQPPGGSGSTAAAQAASSGEYEFRGVYMLQGEYHFNLYNKREQKGTWVSEDEIKEDAPKVVRYSREDDEIIIDLGGRQLTLGMVSTSDKVLPVQTAKAPVVRQPSTSPGSTSSRTPQTPVRRRVIRPTTRTTSTPTIQRPTVQRPTSGRPTTLQRPQTPSGSTSSSRRPVTPPSNNRSAQR
jgi:hypothetical protein